MSTNEGSTPSPRASNATMIRQLVLIGVLVAVGGAAAYDRMSARPGAEDAYKKIQDSADERIGSSAPPLNSEDVQKIIGKAPSYSKAGPNKYVEKYTWMAGLPWRSYYIWVVYSPLEQKSIEANKKPLFEMHFLNEALPADADPDLVAERTFAPPPSEPIGAGAPGAGGPAAGGADDASKGRSRRPAGETPEEGTPDKPAEDKPAEEKPAEDKPAEDKPAEEKPAEEKPAEDKPAEDKPAAENPPSDAGKPPADGQ